MTVSAGTRVPRATGLPPITLGSDTIVAGMCGERVLASIIGFSFAACSSLHPHPALRGQPLLRPEARLVAHLGRALDPIPEIDVGLAEFSRALDVLQYHVGAERAARQIRIEEGIDHREPV